MVVSAHNTTFAEGAEEILQSLEDADKSLAPTFAMVDPFGFKGVPLELIARLLSYDTCEVLFTFIFDAGINRFLTHDEVGYQIEELFGTEACRDAAELEGRDRRAFLHDLYRRQLYDRAGFEYVHSFEMLNQRNRTAYWLFYGTRSLKGLKLMKEAMWQVDPLGGQRFSDRDGARRPGVVPTKSQTLQFCAGIWLITSAAARQPSKTSRASCLLTRLSRRLITRCRFCGQWRRTVSCL